VPNFLKIGQTVAEILTIFQNGSRSPSFICWTLISTTHDEHDGIVAKNSVGIDAVVLMI